jgi:CRISPR system Cascade subunit CasE
LEPETRGNGARLLVQSLVRPEWGNGRNETGKGALRIDTKEFTPQFPEGRHYIFRLRANPVVARDGKRYGLIRDEALAAWLKRKEEGAGVLLGSFIAIDEGYVTGIRKRAKGVDRINIKTARFEGILKIMDPPRFGSALAAGVGPAKGFGCGLLSLSRRILD